LGWYIHLFFTHCTSFFSSRAQSPCSIEDGISKAQNIGSSDFFNSHTLLYVASGSNAIYSSFIQPFHVGHGGAHCIKEIDFCTNELVDLKAQEVKWIHEQHLLRGYMEEMFWACSILDYDTFNFLISIMAPLH
jgi:hypothetical protein